MASRSDFSRFRQTPETIINGVDTYGPWVQPSWLKTRPSENLIGVFQVSNAVEGRPDLISDELYGTSLLDWVLISFNAIHNNDTRARMGLNWPKAGDVIIYPVDSLVFTELT